MFGKTVAVLALAASFAVTGIPPGLAGGQASAGPPGWYDTNASAAQSRANLAEKLLTPSSVTKVKYLRSAVSSPYPRSGQCAGGIVAPLPANGYLYAITNGRLSKYNPATGKLIWRKTPDPSFTEAYDSLAISANLILVGGSDCLSVSDPNGIVYAYNAATGAPVWKALPAGPVDGVVALGSSYVVTAGESAAAAYVVSVFNLSNGKLIWSGDGCLTSGPTEPVVVGLVVIGYGCDNQQLDTLQAWNLATGAPLWSLPTGWAPQRGDLAGSAGSHLYATDPSGTVVDLNPKTGQVEYSLSQAVNVLAVDTSRVYATCGSQGQSLCAYNTSTGALDWQKTNLATPPTSAAEADGVLYLGTGAVLNAATGQRITKIGESPVAVGDGRIVAVPDPRVIDLFGLPGS